ALVALADLPPAQRTLLMLSADRFVESDAPVSRADRLRLLETLDLYGIERALEDIGSGVDGAAALGRRLHERSGVAALAGEVFDQFGRRADAFKAGWALAALSRLRAASTHEQQRIASTVERLTVDPTFLPVQLLRA